jgi:hypothetical protein
MDDEKIKKDEPKTIQEMKDVAVTYNDDIEEHFEVIRLTEKGIITGRLFETTFVPCGFIPKNSYKKIHTISKRETKD